MNKFDLVKYKNVIIIISKPFDPDCISSGLIIDNFLKERKIQSKIIHFGEKNDFADTIIENLNIHKRIFFGNPIDYISVKTDLVILLDGGNISQFFKNKDDFNSIKVDTLQVDHHINNGKGFAKYSILDSSLSSTCELIFSKLLNDDDLNIKRATYLYFGILGDTGNFKWNYTDKTLNLASKCLKLGVDYQKLISILNFNRKKSDFELLSYAINNTEYYDNINSSIYIIPKNYSIEQIKQTKIIYQELFSRTIPKYYLSAIIYLDGEQSKCSVRANGLYNKFNLPQIFKEVNNGVLKGHFNAAPFSMDTNDLNIVKEEYIIIIQKGYR